MQSNSLQFIRLYYINTDDFIIWQGSFHTCGSALGRIQKIVPLYKEKIIGKSGTAYAEGVFCIKKTAGGLSGPCLFSVCMGISVIPLQLLRKSSGKV
jgi:hypothetical protein